MTAPLSSFVLLTEAGGPIQPVEASAAREGSTVVLSVMVSPADYTRIDEAAMLHLDAFMRGPGEGRLDRSRPVRITARLHDARAGVLLAKAGNDAALAAALESASDDDPLCQQDSWYALTVTQEMSPGLWAGYRTEWVR